VAASKSDSSKFAYSYTGDTPKIFRGKLIRSGDAIESDDELINGEFEPSNAKAKAAKVATDAANDAAPQLAADARLAAMNGSLPVEVQADDAPAPAAQVPSAPSTSSSAPAAPAEA
jgi:hypothetical protein